MPLSRRGARISRGRGLLFSDPLRMGLGTGRARSGVNQAGRMGVLHISLGCCEEGVIVVHWLVLGGNFGRYDRVIGIARDLTADPVRPSLDADVGRRAIILGL